MDEIGPEHLELSALKLEKFLYLTLFTFLHLHMYRPISAKLSHNIYDHDISDECDYGFNWTRTIIRVICP